MTQEQQFHSQNNSPSLPLWKKAIMTYIRRNGLMAMLSFFLAKLTRPRNWHKMFERFFRTSKEKKRLEYNLRLPSEIFTDRLIVSNLGVKDVPQIFDLLQASESDWGLFSELISGKAFYCVRNKGPEKVVGLIGVNELEIIKGRKELELGYRIHYEYQRQGFATEATDLVKGFLIGLGIKKLVSVIEPSNLGSIRVATKLGMELEKQWTFGGVNVLVYSVCAPNEGVS